MIQFKNLSIPLKIAIGFAYAWGGIVLLMILVNLIREILFMTY